MEAKKKKNSKLYFLVVVECNLHSSEKHKSVVSVARVKKKKKKKVSEHYRVHVFCFFVFFS